MAHPLKEGPNSEHWRTLPEICMALHMRHTGADETLTDEQYVEAIGYLQNRTQNWRAIVNGPSWYCFDTVVLSLCLVTLDESSRHIIATTPNVS